MVQNNKETITPLEIEHNELPNEFCHHDDTPNNFTTTKSKGYNSKSIWIILTLTLTIIPFLYSMLRMMKRAKDNEVLFASQSRSEKPLCTRSQIQDGYWKKRYVPKPPYKPKSWGTCYDKTLGGRRAGDLEISPFLDWDWDVDTDKCSFHLFDNDRFCHLNSNKTIVFWGDSLSKQQFESMSFLLEASMITKKVNYAEAYACKESTRMIFTRSNRLRPLKDDRGVEFLGLKQIISNYDPNVIVLNTGVHYRPTPDLLNDMEETLSGALQWQQSCDGKGKGKDDCLLVWRTTAPGYPGCDSTPGPLDKSKRSSVEAWIGNSSNSWYMEDPFRQTFYWWDMKHQNAQVENLFQKYIHEHHLSLHFIDFYDMVILRPEAHEILDDSVDCLHWCLPGPPDTANKVLLHIMEVVRSFESAGIEDEE